MRKFIRHPASVPLEYQVNPKQQSSHQLRNISMGGLSFLSHHKLPKNSTIQIRIPSIDPPFVANGTVVWCIKEDDECYRVGVKFKDKKTAFRVRMVEQLCHIEGYRQYVYAHEGRKLTGEEAAIEWIQKFASRFPRFNQ